MRVSFALTLIAVPALTFATLKPCRSNTRGQCPSFTYCASAKSSPPIQAAECSHNTRTHDPQTFAIFIQDHKYDNYHGAPYGTCYAYTCTAPTRSQMVKRENCWTFFWNGNGTTSGIGTGCIKHPETGKCGCENSIDGKFIVGKKDCK